MGTYRTSTTAGHRQARRRATSAIATLAVMGILTACTAATAGAGAKSGRAPGGYPTGAGAAIKAQTSPETRQSLRQEHVAKDDLLSIKLSGGPKATSEYETLRAEHQPAK